MGDPLLEEVLERLRPLGQLRSRRMFGGCGLYCNDVFFALLAWDMLFFKVDHVNRASYLDKGASPFLPGIDNPTEEACSTAGYYEVPLEVQQRPREFLDWAREALAAAERKDARKQPRKKRSKGPEDPGALRVRRLLNLGPISCAWLKSVGIETRAELESVGSLGAYARILAAGIKPNLNLLYALEGALLELNVVRLPAVLKANLRERLKAASLRKKA